MFQVEEDTLVVDLQLVYQGLLEVLHSLTLQM
jgi:hypothetical protein